MMKMQPMIEAQEASDDFTLNKSQWWNSAGAERVSDWVINDAESLALYVKNLTKFDRNEKDAKAIARAKAALASALEAVSEADASYKAPSLVSAE